MTPPARQALAAVLLTAVLVLNGCVGLRSHTSRPGGRSAPSAVGSVAGQDTQRFLTRLEAAAATQGTVEVLFSGDTLDGSGYALLGRDPTGNYVLNMGDTNTEMVVVDGVAYLKDGAVIGGPWTSMPARGIAIADLFTPQALLAAMRPGAASVEDLGPDDLYGTPTTVYEIVVDHRGARSTSTTRPAAATSHEPGTVYTLWVGGGDLLRRVEISTPGGGLILEYGRWGESMEVVAPPPDMVTPVG